MGGGDIWGINGNGQLYFFNFATLSFNPLRDQGIPYAQISVGPTSAFALSDPPPSSVLQIISHGGPVFSLLGSVDQVQAGGNGVWGIDPSQQVFRFDPMVELPVQIQGAALVSISVGSGGGVWGLNGAGQPFGFTTP